MEEVNDKEVKKSGNVSDHLANERTFLAWIRTSIGIMAFGFVVVKFTIFIKQISLVLGKQIAVNGKGYSSLIGIMLVAVGALTTLLAYMRYRTVKKQLDNSAFRSSSGLIITITAVILLISISLVAYLVQSV
jgi:putative membrane protein